MASTTYPAGDAWGPLTLGRSIRDGARRLAELAATPLVPADYLDVFNPLRRGAELRGRVVSVTPETEDAATLVIKPGADWAGHIPGQYVRVGIDVDGVRLWRAYSLTHGPRDDGYISITVKAVPEGKVSNHIVRDCRPGTLVHLEQAAGEFVLPTPVAPDRQNCCSSPPAPASPRSSGCCATCSRSPTPARCASSAARTSTSPSCTSRPASRTRSSSTTCVRSTRPG